MKAAVGDGAELTRDRGAKRGHHRRGRRRCASRNHLLKPGANREEDQETGVPRFIVVLGVDDDPHADARSGLGDFERFDLDVGLPRKTLIRVRVAGASQKSDDQEKGRDEEPKRGMHATTLRPARQYRVRDASRKRQRSVSSFSHDPFQPPTGVERRRTQTHDSIRTDTGCSL